MQRRFEGKVVVLTGASAGIGAEVARRFAAEGATLALAARTPGPLEALAAELAAGGARALAVATDVADVAQCERLIDRAVAEYGGIHILVNNAGAHFRGEAARRSPDELATMVDVDLRAPVVLTRLALPHLCAAGDAAIVNVASLAGMVPLPEAAVYSATKMGLRTFSMALQEELRPTGVSVSLVSPGPVDTDFLMESIDEVADVVFAQPMSSVAEVAAAVLDCAHDGAMERALPRSSAYLARLASLLPPLRRVMAPVMKRRGRRVKERYRARQDQPES